MGTTPAASPARSLLGAAAGRARTAVAAQGNGRLTPPIRRDALARGGHGGGNYWMAEGTCVMAAELMAGSIIAAIEVQCIPPVSPSVLLVIVT